MKYTSVCYFVYLISLCIALFYFRQFDLRAPHQCSNVCSNVLVNLVNHLGRSAEAKCIAINPVNPDLIAVGANDPYVRMYDRRMIKPITARVNVMHCHFL